MSLQYWTGQSWIKNIFYVPETANVLFSGENHIVQYDRKDKSFRKIEAKNDQGILYSYQGDGREKKLQIKSEDGSIRKLLPGHEIIKINSEFIITRDSVAMEVGSFEVVKKNQCISSGESLSKIFVWSRRTLNLVRSFSNLMQFLDDVNYNAGIFAYQCYQDDYSRLFDYRGKTLGVIKRKKYLCSLFETRREAGLSYNTKRRRV